MLRLGTTVSATMATGTGMLMEFGAGYKVGQYINIAIGSDEKVHMRVDGYDYYDGNLFLVGPQISNFLRHVADTFIGGGWGALLDEPQIYTMAIEGTGTRRFETLVFVDPDTETPQ
jgi:hypothetical protein